MSQIRDSVSEQIYKAWFEPLVFEQFDLAQRRILVQVPSAFVYEYLEQNFLGFMGKVLCRNFGQGIQLSYRIVTDKEHNLSQDVQSDPPMRSHGHSPVQVSSRAHRLLIRLSLSR